MTTLTLTDPEREELRAQLRRRNLPSSLAVRMRIVLMLDAGASYEEIQSKLETSAPTISRWKQRYAEQRMSGLLTVHPGQPPQKLTPQLRAKILARTQQQPSDGSTPCSLRELAAAMNVVKDLVRQVWKEAQLQPNRLVQDLAR